jgi:hypothetical protein
MLIFLCICVYDVRMLCPDFYVEDDVELLAQSESLRSWASVNKQPSAHDVTMSLQQWSTNVHMRGKPVIRWTLGNGQCGFTCLALASLGESGVKYVYHFRDAIVAFGRRNASHPFIAQFFKDNPIVSKEGLPCTYEQLCNELADRRVVIRIEGFVIAAAMMEV